MSSGCRGGARKRDHQNRIGVCCFQRLPCLLACCFVDVMFQNIMERAKHLILHHCHLVALLQKIFCLFAGNLICLLGLHDYREIGRCLVCHHAHGDFVGFENVLWAQGHFGFERNQIG